MDKLVFPQRNLGAANPWGRDVQNKLQQLERGIHNLGLQIDSMNRANAGTSGVLGRQIEELVQHQASLVAQAEELRTRQTTFINIGTISNTFTLSGSTLGRANTTRTVTVPQPIDGSNRAATVYLFGEAYAAQSFTFGSHVFVRAFGLGEYAAAPQQASRPSGWFESVSFNSTLAVGATSFAIRVDSAAQKFTTGNQTITTGIRNVRAVVVYGAKP